MGSWLLTFAFFWSELGENFQAESLKIIYKILIGIYFSVELIGSVDVEADAEPFTKRVRSGRLPPTGLYNETISCILVSKFCKNDQCELSTKIITFICTYSHNICRNN